MKIEVQGVFTKGYYNDMEAGYPGKHLTGCLGSAKFFPTMDEVDEMFDDFFTVKDNGDDVEEHY